MQEYKLLLGFTAAVDYLFDKFNATFCMCVTYIVCGAVIWQ